MTTTGTTPPRPETDLDVPRSREHDDVRTSAAEKARMEALLLEAEPRRRAAFASSLNMIGGVSLMIAGSAFWNGSFLPLLIAVMAAAMLWRTCNRLWRSTAIATLAPVIGERWGQNEFSSGWETIDPRKWITNVLDGEGVSLTSWRSEGTYRNIPYRLSETTIWRRQTRKGPRKASHILVAEVRVPQPFPGTIALLPRAGLIGKIDDMLRQVMGDAERRRDIDPAFDAVFDTMVGAGASVETLLTPEFQRAMLALANDPPKRPFTARFEDGWFSLRLSVRQLTFASARLHKPMTELLGEADLLWWDLTVPHRLIDGLRGDHTGPLH